MIAGLTDFGVHPMLLLSHVPSGITPVLDGIAVF